MSNNTADFMKDVLAAPLGELISSIGQGVAEAQKALDEASLNQYFEIYSEGNDAKLALLREIGYQPTFYAIPEAEVEAQVSLAISSNVTGTERQGKVVGRPANAKTRIYATPMNPAVTNKFNADVKGSASIRFKVVPVPPATQVTDIRIIPDLKDLAIEQVEELLTQLNFRYEITEDSGSGKVISQSPEPGRIGRTDQVISVEL